MGCNRAPPARLNINTEPAWNHGHVLRPVYEPNDLPPGFPSTWHSHTGDRTWTCIGNGTWTHTWNRNFTRTGNMTWRHTGNQSWTWTHTGNQTWIQPGNLTAHKRHEGPPILLNGWAKWNMTVAARNITQPILMNGTQGVRLGFIMINASSSNQNIRNLAMNATVAQIEFDHNGSLQVIVNSSIKPSQVLADDTILTQAQTLNGLTPGSEAWAYDSISHTLTIIADPNSVTLVYALTPTTPASTPVPEYSGTFAVVFLACFALVILIGRRTKYCRGVVHYAPPLLDQFKD